MYINNKVVDIKGNVNISGNTLTDTGATPSNVLLYTAENTCKLNVNGLWHQREHHGVSFIPVFSQTYLENDNQKILFLTGNNTLMWPDSHAYTANFRGLRCYFMLKDVANNARTFNLLFDNETTGIQTIAKNVATGNEYFNLSGQRVSMPQKGVYIKNGKKVIVK